MSVLSALGAAAQGQARWYVVDASKPDIPVAAMADIAFLMTSDWEEGIAVISKDGSLSDRLAAITFRQFETTDVKSLKTESQPATYTGLVQQKIVLSNCTAGTAILVYHLNGTKLLTQTASEGKTEIEVGDLPKGVYLLKVGDVTIKFTKK